MNNFLKESYFELTEIWKLFCKLHTDLFELTCEEYSYLLSSDMDQLETVLDKKEQTVELIKQLEMKRKEIIIKINQSLSETQKVEKVHDLLDLMNIYEVENGESYLTKYNSLLIDIIEKIKQQNRRNQLFINKSLNSLKMIREGLSGPKNFHTYNAQGLTGQTKSP